MNVMNAHPHLTPQPSLSVRQLLSDLQWGDGFNIKQIDVIAPYFFAFEVKAGADIFKEGNQYDFFALICEGNVEVIKEDHNGKPKTIATLGSGKAFGEIAFFDANPCSARIIAKTDNILLVMDKENFAKLSVDHAHLALDITIKVLKTVSQRLRQTTGRLTDSL